MQLTAGGFTFRRRHGGLSCLTFLSSRNRILFISILPPQLHPCLLSECHPVLVNPLPQSPESLGLLNIWTLVGGLSSYHRLCWRKSMPWAAFKMLSQFPAHGLRALSYQVQSLFLFPAMMLMGSQPSDCKPQANPCFYESPSWCLSWRQKTK